MVSKFSKLCKKRNLGALQFIAERDKKKQKEITSLRQWKAVRAKETASDDILQQTLLSQCKEGERKTLVPSTDKLHSHSLTHRPTTLARANLLTKEYTQLNIPKNKHTHIEIPHLNKRKLILSYSKTEKKHERRTRVSKRTVLRFRPFYRNEMNKITKRK